MNRDKSLSLSPRDELAWLNREIGRRGLFKGAGLLAAGGGLTAAEALLTEEPRPSAIFASNDDMAAAAAAVAHRHRLDVPQDISIVGYDDTPIATTIWPELTTIRQPIQDMARLGTRLLIEAVQHRRAGHGQAVRHERLDFELVARASDAERA